VNDCVVMYDTMKDARIGIPEVIEKFGVPPDKVIEVQALIGDTSDNVPGVPGIGVKTAAQLIGEYGDLETLLKRASEIKQDKRRQALIDNAEAARMSKKLVTLDDRVPLDVPIESLGVQEPDYKALIAFLKSMGFKTLIQRVAEKSGVDAAQVEPGGADSAPSAKPGAPPVPSSRTAGQGQLPLDVTSPRKTPGPSTPALTPISLAERRLASLRQGKPDATKYETIETLDRLQHWIARAHETGVLALKTETSNLDPMQTALCGLATAVAPHAAPLISTWRKRKRPICGAITATPAKTKRPGCLQPSFALGKSLSVRRSMRSNRFSKTNASSKLVTISSVIGWCWLAVASGSGPPTTRC